MFTPPRHTIITAAISDTMVVSCGPKPAFACTFLLQPLLSPAKARAELLPGWEAVGYGVAKGKDLGVLWSQQIGQRRNRCLMLGEVLDLQRGGVGPSPAPFPPLILCCVVHMV